MGNKLFKSPIKSIRAKCLDCTQNQPKEIRLCTTISCALYPYRMGRRPSNETLDTLKSFYEETIDTVEERVVNTCINLLLGRSATSELDGISKAKLSSLYARRETLRSKRGRT